MPALDDVTEMRDFPLLVFPIRRYVGVVCNISASNTPNFRKSYPFFNLFRTRYLYSAGTISQLHIQSVGKRTVGLGWNESIIRKD